MHFLGLSILLFACIAHAYLEAAFPRTPITQCGNYTFYWTGGAGIPYLDVIPVSDYLSPSIPLAKDKKIDTDYVYSFNWTVNYPQGTQLVLNIDVEETSHLMTVGAPLDGASCNIRATNTTITDLHFLTPIQCGSTSLQFSKTNTSLASPQMIGVDYRGWDSGAGQQGNEFNPFNVPSGVPLIFFVKDWFAYYGCSGVTSGIATVQSSGDTSCLASYGASSWTSRASRNESWISLVGQKYVPSIQPSTTAAVASTSAATQASSAIASQTAVPEQPGGLTTTTKAVVGAVVGVVVIVAILLFFFLRRRHQRNRVVLPNPSDDNEEKGYDRIDPLPLPLNHNSGLASLTTQNLLQVDRMDSDTPGGDHNAQSTAYAPSTVSHSDPTGVLSILGGLTEDQRLALFASISANQPATTQTLGGSTLPPTYKDSR